MVTRRGGDVRTGKRRRAALQVEELERRIALAAPSQKKTPTPAPYMPGTYYGLMRRSSVREET